MRRRRKRILLLLKYGVLVKDRPLKGPPERNIGISKAPENPYDTEKMIGKEQGRREIPKWVLGEVIGTCWIRAHEVPFWGSVVGKAQLKVVGIGGLLVKWDRQARRRWKDLRDKIGKGEYQMPNYSIDRILLEERLLLYKDYIFWNSFKGRVLCQGQGDWAARLPQSYNHKAERARNKRN